MNATIKSIAIIKFAKAVPNAVFHIKFPFIATFAHGEHLEH